MIYHVTATLTQAHAAELLRRLQDGSIAGQRPDGPELVASMHRAVINAEGRAEWSELCYCNPPLAHERATVLDHHFTDIRTTPIDEHRTVEGQPLMEVLRSLAAHASA